MYKHDCHITEIKKIKKLHCQRWRLYENKTCNAYNDIVPSLVWILDLAEFQKIVNMFIVNNNIESQTNFSPKKQRQKPG